MAIYDTGTASLSASGQVTGVGTRWAMPLTLIRAGATLIFKTDPVQIYTISEITSDTSMSVYNPKGETVPAGTGYAILAHDGISVQGLAQDVAETLRYYQSSNYVSADEDGNVSLENGGTGASTPSQARDNLQVPATSDVLLKNDNLASLSDKGQAWLNIRPTGPTNLSANPESPLDATTKQWVEGLRSIKNSWSVVNSTEVSPVSGTSVSGGTVLSEYKIGATTAYNAALESYGVIGGTPSQQGARISTGAVSYDFTASGALMLPNSSTQIGTRRPDGIIAMDAYLRPRDVIASPGQAVGVSASERNAIRMINYKQVTPGYVGRFYGDWYDGAYSFGGVRGSGVDLERAQITVNNGLGLQGDFQFFPNGTAQCTNWQSTSDRRLKTNIKRIEKPLEKMRAIRGVTWERLDKSATPDGIGFIAQEVEDVFPEYVNVMGSYSIELKDGTTVDNIKSLDTGGIAAALHHEAILALMDEINELQSEILAIKSANK